MFENLKMICGISILLFTTVACSKAGNNSKRILLNDPDVIVKRLDNMEIQLAHLQTELAQEKGRIAYLQTNLTQEKANIVNLQNELAQEKGHIVNLQSELGEEKVKNIHLQNILQNMTSPGSTYVRWGRKTCSGSDLVYTGFAAGQPEIDKDAGGRFGGPSNVLCLPNVPELSNKTAPGASFLYGTEYEENMFAAGAIDEDVPCALCRRSNTFATIMIPGKRSCYVGWKIEYQGFLSSSGYGQKASSYICVDAAPEFLQAGKDNKNGHLLYITGTKCGSLPCPPYTDNMAIYCVVCSK